MKRYLIDDGGELDGHPELLRKRARVIIVTWLAIAVIVIVTAMVFALLSYNAWQSIKTRQALLDCTQPTGTCHRQSQQETGEYIKKLLDAGGQNHQLTRLVVLYAAACADRPGEQGEAQIEACVRKKLDLPK